MKRRKKILVKRPLKMSTQPLNGLELKLKGGNRLSLSEKTAIAIIIGIVMIFSSGGGAELYKLVTSLLGR